MALHCWSVDGPTELWSASDAQASIPCPTPDGSQVVIGGPNHSLQIRDAAGGGVIEGIAGDRPDHAMFFSFSPDGRYLVSQGHLGHRVVWDWQQKTIVNFLPTDEASIPHRSAPVFTPDSQQLVIATGSGAVEFRDIHPAPAQMVFAGHERPVKGVAFSPDGRQVASVSRDGTLRTWSTDTGQELQTLPAHPSAFYLAYSPDGTRIATGGSDGTKLWSTDTGRLLHHWPDNGQGWWIDFGPDGQRVIAGGSMGDSSGKGVLSLFDVASGQVVFTREMPGFVDGLVFSADERRAVSVVYQTGRIEVWDLKAGTGDTIRPGELSPDHSRCLVRSPQGNQVALAIGGTIELWDIDRRQLVNTLEADGDTPYCLAFNHDGSRLFSGDTGGLVKVWNLDTGEVLFTMHAHEPTDTGNEGRITGVHSLMLSPDGKTLVTAGADGLVKLWETTRPSKALARQRRIVRDAAEAVNQRYRISPAHHDVIVALEADRSLDPEVLRTAIQIADARGDRPRGPVIPPSDETEASHAQVLKSLDEARRAFAALVEEASHADFDAVDPNSPEECDGAWVWDANYRLIPDFTLEELDYLLDPLVQQYPEAHQFLCLRGFVNGRKQRWLDAAADFKAALERVPEKTGLWTHYAYLLATLYVHQGDFDRYHALRERAMQHALEMDDPHVFELTSKMYLFSGHGGTRVDDAVRLARSTATGVPTDVFRWYSLAAGIAEYRHGNWELAIEMLQQARAPGSQVPTLLATSHSYQALSYRRLEQHDRAQESLSAAEQIMSRPGYGEMDWWNAFIAEAADKEARQLFADAGTGEGPASEPNSAAGRRAKKIVPPGSTWRWLHPADGVDPASEDRDFHETFFSLSYDDSRWPAATDGSGADGGFGYGDPAGVEFDVPAQGNRKTAYFRHRFTTDQAYDELIVSMQRDDGMIVYLDGKEVGRNNVGDAAEAYDLAAKENVTGEQETWVGFYALSASLEPGEHVLAISLHNSAAQDSDLRVAEISLWGTPRAAPTDR